MTTFTDKELIKEIKERIGSLDVRDNIERRAYEIALASLEAEPVVYMWDSERKDIDAPGYYRTEHLVFAESSVKQWGGRVVPLYTAPPATVAPDGWISCSERMPPQDDWILIYSKHGEYMAGQVQGEYVELSDGTLSWLGNVLFWMPLPEPPKGAK
ncbi:DUF551 domain-containing protein [Escherichia coli]|nr:DUF551 domain-containing protein [Escherichia coli]EFH8321618.1 DUF551 domain-containing protein [Escherichia coli]EFN5797475.1 DUF551 domain-containing protein [Escherichia coli]EFT3093063.1 DUF551 domain-containing protein [Escherichia coli]EGI4265732.1 DUF551 domain-containing protein [Escherichia coli]